MRQLITAVLAMAWLVVGYFGLLWAAKRFFSGRFRAETVAATVLVAFAVGVNWPRAVSSSTSTLASASSLPAPSLPAPSPPAAVPVGIAARVEVEAACASAHLSTVAGKGNVDTTTRSGAMVIANGWAADTDLKGPATSVCLLVDGKIVSSPKIIYGANRPDVAAAYQNTALTGTGFEITLPARLLDGGAHHIQAAAVGANGDAAVLNGDIRLAKPPPRSKS